MNKVIGKISNIAGWLVIAISIILFFFVNLLEFSGVDFQAKLLDLATWVSLATVIFLNISVKLSTQNVSLQYAISQDEFKRANVINNDIVRDAVNHFDELVEYVENHNKQQFNNAKRTYLFDLGKKDIGELTRKQLRKYNKHLRYDKITLFGFIKPILSMGSGWGNKTSYNVNVNLGKDKVVGIIMPIINGIVMTLFTLSIFLKADVVNALLQFASVAVGLTINFIITAVPIIYNFLIIIPKKVEDKFSQYSGFKESKFYQKPIQVEPIIKPITLEDAHFPQP